MVNPRSDKDRGPVIKPSNTGNIIAMILEIEIKPLEYTNNEYKARTELFGERALNRNTDVQCFNSENDVATSSGDGNGMFILSIYGGSVNCINRR